MKIFIILAALLVAVICSPNGEYKPSAEELLQNKNAKYYFESTIEDNINNANLQRIERRDGLNLHGSYSFSDGLVKKTVNYVADDKGYRVTSEEETALTGPKVNPSGTASVDIFAHGNHVKYQIKSVPAANGETRITDLAK